MLKLSSIGIETMSALADSDAAVVPGLSEEAFAKLKNQAKLQRANTVDGEVPFEILAHDSLVPQGLSLLPPHSPADLFFDIEGYPLDENGLEYLWGCTYFDENSDRQFCDFWGHDAAGEKAAFESFIQWAYARWQADTSMHIYHYANYEIAACRRLMGRYGVCEHEVDELLRNEVFVDLYKVVKGGMQVGEPRYSIKNIEKLYRGTRETDVGSGGDSVVVYDNWRTAWLAGEEHESWEHSEVLKSIRDYNIDDCDSTQELVEWLREQQQSTGIAWCGKLVKDSKVTTEEVSDRVALRDALLIRSEALVTENPGDAEVLSTLAWLLEFHRRESKPVFWRFFDRIGMSDQELIDDVECLGGLERTSRDAFKPTARARNLAYEYRFDSTQEYKGRGTNFRIPGFVGDNDKEVPVSLLPLYSDLEAGLIVFSCNTEPPEFVSLVPFDSVNAHPIPIGLQAVAQDFNNDDFPRSAIADFLRRAKPRFTDDRTGSLISTISSESTLADSIDVVRHLDASYVAIQGPPGTGKSFTGTRVIAELLKDGCCIGISSNSHAVINHLLLSVAKFCDENSIEASLYCAQDNEGAMANAGVEKFNRNPDIAARIGPSTVVGTTAWGFSRDDLADQFDYLFVDEAGQVSLANLVAMSRSARNLVLLGDQMQLGQPIQGTHPGLSGLSSLDYLMQDKATVDNDMGIFLPITYRMHPKINDFISKHFYEGKLRAHADTADRYIDFADPEDDVGTQLINKDAGIVYVPVSHIGNTQGSDEEAVMIQSLVAELIGRILYGVEDGPRELTIDDMLFVTPYNLQVDNLKRVLGPSARVGSVDKFQGQEAPVVFISLCASDASESPRGLDFLLDENRFNVALSRGQCLAIVVASPTLAYSSASSLRQMKLLNLFCAVTQCG